MRKSTLKTIFIVISSLITVVLIAAGAASIWAFNNPVDAFKAVQKYILPEDLSITWDTLEIDTKYEGGLNFSFDLVSEDFKLQKSEPELSATFNNIIIHATLYFSKNRPHDLHKIEIISEDAISFKPSDQPQENQDEQSFYQQVQNPIDQINYLKEKVKFGELNINLPVIQIASTSPLTLSLQAKKEDNEQIALGASLDSQAYKVDLSATLFPQAEDAPLLSSEVNFSAALLESALTIKAFHKPNEVTVSLAGELRTKNNNPLQANPQAQIVLTEDEVTLNLETNAKGQIGPFKELKDIKVSATIPQTDDVLWSEEASNSTVSSSVDLLFINQRIIRQIEQSCSCQLPKSVTITLDSEFWLSRLMSKTQDTQDVANIKVEIEKIENKLFDIELLAELLIQKENTQYFFTPNLNSTIDISSFQSVVQILGSNNILIPTPLNLLDGRLSIRSRGTAEATSQFSEIPLEIALDLASKEQKVKLTTTAVMSLHRTLQRADLTVQANIDAINLILPPLDPIRGTPRVVKDARILQTPKKAKKSKFQMNLEFDVKTNSDGAVKLFHEYFQPHLPVTLNLTSAPNGNSFLKVEPFDIVYLRRKVSVNRLILDLGQAEEEVIPIDARLQVDQTQYTVFIDIKGSLKEPQIVLSSEPALSEDDIVAVLLYDQTRSELGAGDAENSAGVQSAIADRAIGLFGLWAFAATPIKRFSYNPVTKVYSAAIEVSDSVTAEIGTNWEETTNLELHKRLSRRWVLTAAWTPATTDTKETQKLMLQWEKRF